METLNTPMQSEDIAELAAALSAFQGQVHGAAKNATNPHLKNKYADLSSIWEAIREPLAKNGLAVVQPPMPAAEGYIALQTKVVHKSGQWMASEITMPMAKRDPQGYGSALTYARRYGLAAMLGITQEDDDGNAASGRTQRRAEPEREEKEAMGLALTQAQLRRMFAIAKEHGVAEAQVKDLMIANFGKDSTKKLSTAEYEALCNTLIPGAAQAETGAA